VIEIQPWFLEFVRDIRCQEHRAPITGHLNITVVKPVAYIGEMVCQAGEGLVAVGLQVYRPPDPIELPGQALEIWNMVAPPMPCRSCHQYTMKDFLIAVRGKQLRQGEVRSRCADCLQEFGLPMFWTYHLAPVDRNEVLDLHERLKQIQFVSDLLH